MRPSACTHTHTCTHTRTHAHTQVQAPPHFMNSQRLQRVNNRVNCVHGNHNHNHNHSLHHYSPPPSALSCPPVAPATGVQRHLPAGAIGPLTSPQLSLQQEHQAWRDAAADFTEHTLFSPFYSLPAPSQTLTSDSSLVPNSAGYGGVAMGNCYSLFSEGQSVFGTNLISASSTPSPSHSPTSQSSFCSQERGCVTPPTGHTH